MWLKRLNTLLNKTINKNSVKVPKVVKPTKNKTLYKALGTSVINNLQRYSHHAKLIYNNILGADGEVVNSMMCCPPDSWKHA